MTVYAKEKYVEVQDRMAKARAAKAAKKEATSQETVDQKRERLLKELADLPAIEVANDEPGTLRNVGTLLVEKVPFTRRWFENNAEMVEFFPVEAGQVILNGVKYAWQANERTKIPATHFAVLEDSRKRQVLSRKQFDPPAQLPMTAGQSSPIYRSGEGLIEPIPDDK